MKKSIFPILLFLFMVIGLYFSTNYMHLTYNNLLKTACETEENIAFNEWDNAYINSVYLLKEFEHSMSYITLFLNHEELDSVYDEVLKLTQFTNQKDKVHSLSTIHLIKGLIESLDEEQKINIKNIF